MAPPTADSRPDLLTADDLGDFPSPPADAVIRYGDDPLQFGELRLPGGNGPFPVMLLIHGGCWLADYDIAHIRKLAHAFAREGIATWSIEYRRVGNPGGGWPGTFDDVVAGGEFIRELATRYPIDAGRILAAGHSAGGHLALWFAARPVAFRAAGDVEPAGVLALAPASDLEYLHRLGAYDDVVGRLLGGSPDTVPERYRQASGIRRIPLAVPHIVLLGRYDHEWRPVGERYVEAARAAGAPLEVVEADRSGHFELIDPDSDTWPLVLDAARRLLAGGRRA